MVVGSLTTGTNTAGASINFDQTGGGGVTFTGPVRSGTNPGVNGGAITLTSDADIEIAAASTVDSRGGTSGTLDVSGATISGTVNVGAGNVIIQGGQLDTIIAGSLMGTGAINVTAVRDVIVRDTITTTSGDITITADTDNISNMDALGDAQGGVLIEAAGLVSGSANVTITGADLLNLGAATGTVESVQIDADGLNTQIDADGNILVQSSAGAPAAADIIVNGRVSADLTGTLMITANQDARFGVNGDLTANGGQITVTADNATGNTGGLIFMADGALFTANTAGRSEERRGGKECRCRGSPCP